MTKRKIKKMVQGQRTIDGAGVHLVRVLDQNTVTDFDPFLMLDSFDSENPNDYLAGFPFHPHRGIETITYLIEGEMNHKDSLGNRGKIRAHESQWMTAGSGIMHEEMPQKSDRMLGFQLWINLPQQDKMTEPAYNTLEERDIPRLDAENATIRLLSGNYHYEKQGFKPKYVQADIWDIDLKPNKIWMTDTIHENTVFVFLMEGSLAINDEVIPNKTAVLFDEGDQIEVQAGKNGARFAYFSAPRLEEPVAWGGPIVMNTRKELAQAFEELESGTFIK